MSEAQRLREQAALCHRLVRTMLDERMAKALREYAADVEKKAAILEGDYAGAQCSSTTGLITAVGCGQCNAGGAFLTEPIPTSRLTERPEL